MKLLNKMGVAAVLAGVALLAGCTGNSRPDARYFWGSYTREVYAHFQNDSSPQQQASILEKDLQPGTLKPAPGYLAHLGMLYAMLGQTDKAVDAFRKEQTLYPESAHYMAFLTNSLSSSSVSSAITTTEERN